eukprot:1158813-Pelagomonas_calceolata.AAC.2
MAHQAPSSSSNPLARWLKPVTPNQQLLADQARLARPQAYRKGLQAKQKSPVGRFLGDSSDDVACMGSTDDEVCPSKGAKMRPSLSNPLLLSSSSSSSSLWAHIPFLCGSLSCRQQLQSFLASAEAATPAVAAAAQAAIPAAAAAAAAARIRIGVNCPKAVHLNPTGAFLNFHRLPPLSRAPSEA